MASYQEARAKLTNTQLNKLKSAAKNKTGTTLRLNKKNFENEELPHELFLTTIQTTKLRNAFPNNMSTDLKLSKAQISKIIQSGRSFGSRLPNLRGKKALTNVAISLARGTLPGLVSNVTSSAINKFDRKSKRSCQSRKMIYFIYFEWRYEWYKNYKIIQRSKCTNWRSYWNSKR